MQPYYSKGKEQTLGYARTGEPPVPTSESR